MSVFQEENYNKRFDFELWKRFLKYLKPYKKMMIKLACIMTMVGCIDASFPLMTKYAIDNFIQKKTYSGIGLFAAGYFTMVIWQVVNVWNLISTAGKVETNTVFDMRKKGFKKLQELSFSYYDKTPAGWIMARMTSDIQRLGDTLAWGIVDLVWGMAMMTFVAAYMIYLNYKLALITLIVIPPLAVISLYFQKHILAAYRSVRKTNSRITGAFNEGIMGAKTTKVLVTEKKNLGEFKQLTDRMNKSSVTAAVLSSVYLPIVMSLGSIGTALAITFGGKGVLLSTIGYGTLVAFISYTVQFFEPVRELARVLAEMLSAQASAERVISLIETEPTIKDKRSVLDKYGDVFTPKRENYPVMNGDIEFRNVSFKYDEGEKVLENLDLKIKAGESIALVGETGSGKSTIVNLALRFYEPTEGSILIDGVDYRERSQLWLQDNLGYVLQTPHLFSGTVADNISYGKLDATRGEIIEAAKIVNADDFIKKLHNGYDTEVGEGGNLLSTGQKQLISLARAVLKNPRIFVLDEATSSIDTETEMKIQNAVNTVLKGRTSFIVAHRLSTIKSADRILVIEDGRITEEGNHKSLLKKRGFYYRLYTNQFKREQEEMLLSK